MISKFRKFIEKERLFEEDDKILLACSGGIDSMVLADLLLTNGTNFGIAHINHMTRGDNSDADQQFVESYCTERDLPFHTVSAPISEMASDKGENFHAFARQYRYRFFNDLKEKYGYNIVATAHHNSDALETFIFNLTRGAGLDGLTGITTKSEKVIRPLMFVSKKDIISYADKYKIAYKEDASNASNKYTRNLIRNKVVPELSSISDQAAVNAKASITKLKKTKQLLSELIDSVNLIYKKEERLFIEKKALLGYSEKETLLYYLLKEFGFNFSQCEQIYSSIKNTGSLFYSPTHQLLVDRKDLIIATNKERAKTLIHIDKLGTFKISESRSIKFEETTEIHTGEKIEYFDAEKLVFPLTIRNWSDGDRFTPLGMKSQNKKIKDYLIDNKIDRFQKREELVLVSNQEIAWLVGHRISQNFKYSNSTSKYIKATLLN